MTTVDNFNENDIDYLIDRNIYFKNLFNNFLTKYNIDQVLLKLQTG